MCLTERLCPFKVAMVSDKIQEISLGSADTGKNRIASFRNRPGGKNGPENGASSQHCPATMGKEERYVYAGQGPLAD